MENDARQNRLLSRLLGKLRGDHRHLHKKASGCKVEGSRQQPQPPVSLSSSKGMGAERERSSASSEEAPGPSPAAEPSSASFADDRQFAVNIDLRYGGQYLTPEQLPEFCDQLHHLVEVIRNIQSYAKVTGEYPSEAEVRLEAEARSVLALAEECRHARDVGARVAQQGQALGSLGAQLAAQLARLKDEEARELEGIVRLSDRKLFKNWETLKESNDPSAFEPLLDEIRSAQKKQTALEGLARLVGARRAQLSSAPPPAPPPALPLPDAVSSSRQRERAANRRAGCKRKRSSREPRSAPLSEEPSLHSPPQVWIHFGD